MVSFWQSEILTGDRERQGFHSSLLMPQAAGKLTANQSAEPKLTKAAGRKDRK